MAKLVINRGIWGSTGSTFPDILTMFCWEHVFLLMRDSPKEPIISWRMLNRPLSVSLNFVFVAGVVHCDALHFLQVDSSMFILISHSGGSWVVHENRCLHWWLQYDVFYGIARYIKIYHDIPGIWGWFRRMKSSKALWLSKNYGQPRSRKNSGQPMS